MFHFINKFVRRVKLAARLMLRGEHYDSATYDNRNDRHFANARDLPPIVTNNYDTRKKLRVRARYEADNNCYLSGLCNTLATDVVGYVLPSLQVLTPDAKLNAFIEAEWKKWSEFESVNLCEKLKMMDRASRTDGESFLMMVSDRYTESKTGYSLNVVIIPASRVTDQSLVNFNPIEKRKMSDEEGIVTEYTVINDDGVIVDATTGRPIEFKVIPLVDEVQGLTSLIQSNSVTVSARYMKQWFRPKWPGQFRGVCEVAPALPLYAQLRRFDIATMTSAEVAAMIAGVMKTTNPANDEPPEIAPGTELGLVPGSLIAAPDGWEPVAFPSNAPLSTYEMFVYMVLRQIGRLLDVPFGIVAGDHSKYNYSSARLDVTGYDEGKKYDRKQLEIRALNPVAEEFLFELSKLRPDVARYLETEGIPYGWNFTNRPSIDPAKDASVDDIRLKNGTITLAEIYSAKGKDWEEALEQRAKESKKIAELGLVFDTGSPAPVAPVPTSDVAQSQGNF